MPQRCFCNVVIRQNDVVVIPDTLEGERFEYCLRTRHANVRFHRALINAKGFALGTLCLVDLNQEPWITKIEAIRVLARQVVATSRGKQVGLAANSTAAQVVSIPPQGKRKSEKFLQNVLYKSLTSG